MADIEEIQEYLWKNLIFHEHSLEVELESMSPLIENLGNPVPHMLRRDFWRFNDLFELERLDVRGEMC